MKRTQILILLLLFAAMNTFGQGVINFEGVIKNADTGELLEGVNVFVVERNTGTITNYAGEFFFFFTGGIYNVMVSANGYKTERLILDLREDKYLEIQLTPTSDDKRKIELGLRKKSEYPDQVKSESIKAKTVKSSSSV